jgi:hypothetical protein
MKEIIVQVPDTKVNFFLELLNGLGILGRIRESEVVSEDEDMIIPEFHKEIVRERMKKYANNPQRVIK